MKKAMLNITSIIKNIHDVIFIENIHYGIAEFEILTS